LTAINNRCKPDEPTDLTVVPTVRSEVAHRDAESTVRNDDWSDGIFLKPPARVLRAWLIVKFERVLVIVVWLRFERPI